MQPFRIEATDDSPKIILDDQNHVFLFEGESRPQHAFKFFQPVIQWLEEYGKILFWQKEHFGKNRRMTFQFKLSYFNSTSAKFIGDILSILDNFCKEGYEVRVKWFYHKEDSDMKESAEEYLQMMKKLPIKLVLTGEPEDKN
ncbi:MAG: DUF1987 domain-containing protein [Bacteroidetes bacterium]|nr:MAG: DUF1987 domain-containing protein [Bacteroidota bacterium]